MVKRRKVHFDYSYGRHFGRPDLDRAGFFDDTPYGPFDNYGKLAELRSGVTTGRQMLAGRSGSLFEKKFVRIFEGEVLRKDASTKDKKIKEGKLLPPSPAKKHSTPGDWFGCFGKKMSYFNPEVREIFPKRKERSPPNFKIKPNPLGGPGYLNICLNPYPKYASEPYYPEAKEEHRKGEKPGKFISTSAPLDYFPPNPYTSDKIASTYTEPVQKKDKIYIKERFYVPFPKRPGGNHSGCFSKFPEYSSDPYQESFRTEKEKRSFRLKWIAGGPPLRSKYTNSIIEQITSVSCNSTNYAQYRNNVYPLRDF